MRDIKRDPWDNNPWDNSLVKTTWTAPQILALAPDAASAKSGQALANARSWVTLGAAEDAAWGECQGSGKNPYQAQVALAEPAFKCSCPSRKFPCKHGLGLLLLLEKQPQAFDQAETPEWVSQWLASRAQKAEHKAKKPEKAEADPAASAKRAAGREAKVTAGLTEMDRWLRDLVRAGLADAPSKPYSFWDGQAARLVDAQAPGAARLVRALAGASTGGAGGADRLLERLGRLHLLAEGWRNLGSLPDDTQADVRAALGFTVREEDVLAGPLVRDRWLVLGQSVEDEDRLRVGRTWLRGQATGRDALVLQFAHATQALETGLVPGSALEADLAFYPSAYPLRALVTARHEAPSPLGGLPDGPSLSQATGAYAAALARLPWLERFPMALSDVTPQRDGARWIVRDSDDVVLPLAVPDDRGWALLALSGGHPLALFGTWDGDALSPLSAFTDGRFTSF